MKRIISLFTSICIIFSMFGTFTVFAEETAADWEISTLEELEAFRDSVVIDGTTYEGKTVVLMNDIDLGGDEDNQWTPIGLNNKKTIQRHI